jgi:hypothetical protein
VTDQYMKLDDQIAPADLSTESAVDAWFRALGARGVEFHPEETFAELIDTGTGKPTFRLEDAEQLDRRMRLAYEVCDPCAVALRIVKEDQREARPQRPAPSGEAAQKPPELKITEQGSKVEVATIRGFLKRTLGDDAVADIVNDLLFEHVVAGRFHPSVVAESLPGYINEILNTASREDWQAVADELIAEARELNGEV